jgi:hypothetical protein
MKNPLDVLLFPADRHERGPDPGPFVEHRSYKTHLQREFSRKCVYCRIPDGLKGDEAFGVDHYLPKSRFPDLIVAWSNLFYACNVCNTWKGESVSTPDLFLPNPCEHRMSDHLQYSDSDVEAYTAHGEWLAELLHLKERRQLREFILFAAGSFLKIRSELVDDLAVLEDRLDDTRSAEELSSLKAAIRDTVQELEQVDRHIERLIGERSTR